MNDKDSLVILSSDHLYEPSLPAKPEGPANMKMRLLEIWMEEMVLFTW